MMDSCVRVWILLTVGHQLQAHSDGAKHPHICGPLYWAAHAPWSDCDTGQSRRARAGPGRAGWERQWEDTTKLASLPSETGSTTSLTTHRMSNL